MDGWRSVESLGEFDVIVAGSGSAGSTAAIAAARQGARVLLVEKLPFLGGNSTAVLDTFYGFYAPGSRSVQVVAGIPGEVVEAVRSLCPVLGRPSTYWAGTGGSLNQAHLKIVRGRLVTRA